MKNLLNGRIETIFTLLSPLSHIGQSIGTDSYLVTQDLLDAEGNPTEVFVYSGNALRGMWRDTGAKYMFDKLGVQAPLDIFYLFFSGGSIGGDQSTDIDQERQIRKFFPHLSIFGGAVGNMILSGKMNIDEALPVCRELRHIIPDYCPGNRTLSWRQMTTEVNYTRKDDAKDELLAPYIQDFTGPALEAPKQGQMMLLPDNTEEKKENERKGKKSKEEKADDRRPQQMRYTLEVFCRGAVLWHEMTFKDFTEIELGALVACIVEWAKDPRLGGQARVGMGKVKAEMYWQPRGSAKEEFLSVSSNGAFLSPPAAEAKQRYDDFLQKYSGYLEENRDMLVKAISGKVADK